MSLWSIMSGSMDLSVADVLKAVLDKTGLFSFEIPEFNSVTVWDLRLPRTMMGIAAGFALGAAGAGIQTALNNPLASPYTMGVSGGAGFGAASAIAFAFKIPFLPDIFLVSAFSFAGGLIPCVLIFFISRIKKASPGVVLLSGIALSYLFTSLTAVIQYFSTEQVLQQIVFWLFGSLSRATWPAVGTVFAVIGISAPFFIINVWKLTALRLGDDAAEGLGVETARLRIGVLAVSSVVTAAAVCFTGIIGFVGLVAPHICRMFSGEDHRFLLPGSCLTGAILLVTADAAGRYFTGPYILPVGIITSFIGVPFFLYLVISGKRNY
ncbi:MAG: FecCD family ABC transporter permease [Fibrobacterota bacterium]